ncbi:hypothetical protein MWN34_10685 [Ancylobacter sp. 6x-1]|uniref:Uncharacterized protein n=1 Tax=Ancylobacter crimeensis TaxID=2579147 RepID=A0ABT0DBP3_9HYPH|nr:hypothetical protein [Ancylobacter crimeensis]MCK0197378.1 hypothetical protein [Ancylobacter crimeensis]
MSDDINISLNQTDKSRSASITDNHGNSATVHLKDLSNIRAEAKDIICGNGAHPQGDVQMPEKLKDNLLPIGVGLLLGGHASVDLGEDKSPLQTACEGARKAADKGPTR